MSFPKPLDSRQSKHSNILENLGTLADTLLLDIFEALDTHFSQLRLQPLSPNSDRVLITGSEVSKDLGFKLNLPNKNLLVTFEGAEIDFTTGIVYEDDGITPLGDNFTPFVLNADEYFYYAVSLKPTTTQADNTINLKVIIKPALAADLVFADAPKAKFSSGVQIGQIWVKQNSLNTGIEDIGWANIIQIGGSGSGGSGSGGVVSDNTIANNQVAPADITDLLFNSTDTRSATIEYVITRETDVNYKRETGKMKFVYDGDTAAWYEVDGEWSWDDAEVEFTITAGGQVQYTSSNLAGSGYVGRIDFNIYVDI